jgi:hypothetical protein
MTPTADAQPRPPVAEQGERSVMRGATAAPKRRFCEQHRAYSSPAAQGYEFPPVLIGAAESENRLNGRQSQPPALVGDPVACARVRAAGAAGPRVAIQFNQVTGRGPVDEPARLGNTKG